MKEDHREYGVHKLSIIECKWKSNCIQVGSTHTYIECKNDNVYAARGEHKIANVSRALVYSESAGFSLHIPMG